MTVRSFTAAALAVAGVLATPPASASAQDIAFEGDLPRMMVFIQEEGRGKVASREMTSFLLEAGFPVIDPALAITSAARTMAARTERKTRRVSAGSMGNLVSFHDPQMTADRGFR